MYDCLRVLNKKCQISNKTMYFLKNLSLVQIHISKFPNLKTLNEHGTIHAENSFNVIFLFQPIQFQ